MNAIKQRTVLLPAFLIIVMAALGASNSRAAGARWSAEVEGVSYLKGKSKREAREQALDDGKRKAVEAYISSKSPAEIIEDKREDVDKILGQAEKWVVSWEVLSEREDGEREIMELKVELNLKKLDPALKSAGIMPSRPLPSVFVVVRGTMGEERIKSAWDKTPGTSGRWNPCEAVISTELERFGFKVVEPGAGTPQVDTETIVNPESDVRKIQVYAELKEKFGAGALVVAIAEAVEAGPEPGEEGAMHTEVSVKFAAVDVENASLLVSERVAGRFQAKGVTFREEQLESVCREASAMTVEALFRAWNPKYLPGEEREIMLVVRGLGSYDAMKEIEKKLRDEGPGVEAVDLSRMSPGEIEFTVRTAVEAEVLSGWLGGCLFSGFRLDAEAKEDMKIEASVRSSP
jgi:hypothetical protein